MFSFRTQGYNGYNLKYSPFHDSRLAVASSANFGLVGNGRLFVLGLTANGIVAEKTFDTQDGLFDLAWSEVHENQLVVASGDGSLKLFDVGLNDFPIQSWQEHKREVFSVHWNLVDKTTFASSSWDGTVKIWSPTSPTSLSTLPTNSCTYSTAWSPHSATLLSAVSSDSHLRVFDTRLPPPHVVHQIAVHAPPPGGYPVELIATMGPGMGNPRIDQPSEILTHDWNKYRPGIIATAGVDKLIRTWDLRNPRAPLSILSGHNYAVRRIASAHPPQPPASPPSLPADGQTSLGQCLGVMDRHSEFVVGIDWCMFGAEGWAGSVGWDEMIWVWDARAVMQ
ncbi:peroxisomal targeting signal 2 receptor [Orbilia oligospora]|uniref:Peroxin-7 n=1 Tax=Orbilia oligospora TaxID=2813651 RepID=A0A7C8QRU6_ORBOL|nr:peroxisomal targeting signal 2 receptor [Orbilia oligospora]